MKDSLRLEEKDVGITLNCNPLKNYLKKSDLKLIEEKAFFFASNWYKFDHAFEREIVFQEISLGFVHENELQGFFRNTFLVILAVLRAVEAEKPTELAVGKNSSFRGIVEQIAKSKELYMIVVDSKVDRKEIALRPNLTVKKLREIRKKAVAIFMPKKKYVGGKKVFIRSRGYLDEVKNALLNSPEFEVFSLDEFLFRKTLVNPFRFFGFLAHFRKARGLYNRVLESYYSKPFFSKKFVFEGIDFSCLFKERLVLVAERDWPEFSFLVKSLSELFEREKPSVLVLWEDFVAFERICTLLARKHGAKSLVIQHGLMHPVSKKGSSLKGFAPLTADYIAVWGPLFKKILVQHGVKPEQVLVTGNPNFDTIINIRKNNEFIEKVKMECS